MLAALLRVVGMMHQRGAGAEAVVSSNPGCLLQLQSSLEQTDPGRSMPMFHLVELVDASIRNQQLGE